MKKSMLMFLLMLSLGIVQSNAFAQEDFSDDSYSDYQEEFEAPESNPSYQQPATDFQSSEEKISPDPSEFEKHGAPPIQDEADFSEYSEDY